MNKLLFDLFFTFAKIGLFTFGGGYAMLPLIEAECVEKKKWITTDEMSTMTAIAESTPGPIAINCSTYTGYMQAGVWGSIIATLGMAMPSFIIIYCISLFFDNFLEIEIIANAFKGIEIAVGILILNAAFNMLKKMSKTALAKVIVAFSCGIILLVTILDVNFSTIYLLLIAGVASNLILSIQEISSKRGEM